MLKKYMSIVALLSLMPVGMSFAEEFDVASAGATEKSKLTFNSLPKDMKIWYQIVDQTTLSKIDKDCKEMNKYANPESGYTQYKQDVQILTTKDKPFLLILGQKRGTSQLWKLTGNNLNQDKVVTTYDQNFANIFKLDFTKTTKGDAVNIMILNLEKCPA